MKHLLLTTAVATAMIAAAVGTSQAQLLQAVAGPPTPGANDAYMLDNGSIYNAQEPAGLNYYSNGGYWGNPGQIFTTGSYAYGYTLQNVYLNIAYGAGGGILGSAQSWSLRIYTISNSVVASTNSVAYLVASYTANFTLPGDTWVEFSGTSGAALGAVLKPNTKYAYTLQNLGSGYAGIEGEQTHGQPGDPSQINPTDSPGVSSLFNASGILNDPNDMACLIPSAGGTLAAGNLSTNYQSQFDVGLSEITTLSVNPPVIATAGNVYPTPQNAFSLGTPVVINAGTVVNPSANPTTYQWWWDQGTGTPVAIAGQTSASYTFANRLSTPGTYNFWLVVGNGGANPAITTASVTVTTAYATQTAALADIGGTVASTPGYLSIYQTVNDSPPNQSVNSDGLYSFDNSQTSPYGEIFTTPATGGPFTLNTLQIELSGGNQNQATTTSQPYSLAIYALPSSIVNGTVAQLIQVYSNADFAFNTPSTDWLQWSGLNTVLQPNQAYAFTFQNANTGWAGFGSTAEAQPTSYAVVPAAPGSFPDGPGALNQDCSISVVNGVVSLGNNAIGAAAPLSMTFSMQLSTTPENYPLANPLVQSPSPLTSIPSGTQVLLTENALGTGLHYKWYTDGGSGGAVTQIVSAADSPTYTSPALSVGVYGYAVLVYNSYNATGVFSPTNFVSISGISGTNAMSFEGFTSAFTPTPGLQDIYQLTDGDSADPGTGNYYINNGTAPGQVFVTGSAPSGYTINSFQIDMGSGAGNFATPPVSLPFTLNIYSFNAAGRGILQASYVAPFVLSPDNTTAGGNGWFLMTNFSTPFTLQPNTTYAYAFTDQPGTDVYDGCEVDPASSLTPALANATGTIQGAIQIGLNGGIPTVGTAGDNAVFDLGLTVAASPAPTMSISRNGSGLVVITWTPAIGTLLSATNVAGPWTAVGGSPTSPYTTTPSGHAVFYGIGH